MIECYISFINGLLESAYWLKQHFRNICFGSFMISMPTLSCSHWLEFVYTEFLCSGNRNCVLKITCGVVPALLCNFYYQAQEPELHTTTVLQALALTVTNTDTDIITDITTVTDTTRKLITDLTDMTDTDMMDTTVLPPMLEVTTRGLTTTTDPTMIIFTDVDTDMADMGPSTKKLVRTENLMFCLFAKVVVKYLVLYSRFSAWRNITNFDLSNFWLITVNGWIFFRDFSLE